MLKPILLVCLASLFTTAVYADDDDDREEARQEPLRPKNGSAYNRGHKPYGIGTGMGVFAFPNFGGEIAGHYNYSPNLQGEATLWIAETTVDDYLWPPDGVVDSDLKLSMALAQARIKFFPVNSFYVAGGFGIRATRVKIDAASVTNRLEKTSTKYNPVVSVAIGNIWTFDGGLYLGGEWVSIAVPLGTASKTTSTTRGTNNSSMQKYENDIEDRLNDYVRGPTVGFANFQIGLNF